MELSERQSEIIEKSINIISEKGIQGLTIKNLSKEIGISEPAIYRHFENKFEILKTMLLLFKDESLNSFYKAKNNSNGALNKLTIFLSDRVEKFKKNPSFASVIFAEDLFRNEPELKKLVTEIMDENTKRLNELIKIGQIEGEIRNDISSDILSLIILGSFRFLIKKWAQKNGVYDIEKNGIELINSIIRLIKRSEK